MPIRLFLFMMKVFSIYEAGIFCRRPWVECGRDARELTGRRICPLRYRRITSSYFPGVVVLRRLRTGGRPWQRRAPPSTFRSSALPLPVPWTPRRRCFCPSRVLLSAWSIPAREIGKRGSRRVRRQLGPPPENPYLTRAGHGRLAAHGGRYCRDGQPAPGRLAFARVRRIPLGD